MEKLSRPLVKTQGVYVGPEVPEGTTQAEDSL